MGAGILGHRPPPSIRYARELLRWSAAAIARPVGAIDRTARQGARPRADQRADGAVAARIDGPAEQAAGDGADDRAAGAVLALALGAIVALAIIIAAIIGVAAIVTVALGIRRADRNQGRRAHRQGRCGEGKGLHHR